MAEFHIDGFVALDQLGQIIGGQIDIGLAAFLFLELAEAFFKRILALFIFDLLNDVAVHLEQTTIRISPETGGVAGGQRINDLIGEADGFWFYSFMCCRAIAVRYARRSALCPAGIRASALAYFRQKAQYGSQNHS